MPVPDPLPDLDLRERYSRQVLFPGIGDSGQQRLAAAHVAIVGVGATGAASAGLLARAGVGHLTLIDRDFVEPSNLQRQTLFDEEDARHSLPKAEAARQHLARINSSINVTAHVADLVPANAEQLLAGADLILDGTDNFETRYLINDLCVRDHRPWIYAAAVGAYAATMNILPKGEGQGIRDKGQGTEPLPTNLSSRLESAPFAAAEERPAAPPTATPSLIPYPLSLIPATPCLSCIFPTAPTGPTETCDTAGILSTAVNLAASLQVTEALKFLTGQARLMRRTFLAYDLWTGEHSEIATTTPRNDCEVCAKRIFHALSGTARPHITLCGRNSVQIHEHHRPIDLLELKTRLQPLGPVRANAHLLRFELPPHTLTVFPDGRALIQGTTDTALARSLYARYIGS